MRTPSASLAVEFQSGFTTEGYWTDNVYAQSVGEVDDFSIRVSPWGEVLDRDGDLTWGLRYNPSYEYYLDESDITWAVRPFLRVAYENDEDFSIGLEASYLWGGNLEFTNEIGGDVEQWYVGVFFAFSR